MCLMVLPGTDLFTVEAIVARYAATEEFHRP
jgi:hypothetical protein